MDYEWRTEVDFPHSYLYFVELTCPRNCSDCEEGICLECDDGFALKTFRNNRTGCIPCGRRLKMKDPASFLQQCINGMFKNRSLIAKIWPFYVYYSTDSFFERPVTVTVYLQRHTLSQHTSIWLNIYFPKKRLEQTRTSQTLICTFLHVSEPIIHFDMLITLMYIQGIRWFNILHDMFLFTQIVPETVQFVIMVTVKCATLDS